MTIGQITTETKPKRQFYHLPEEACSYLEGLRERKRVILLRGPHVVADMSDLTLRGYRRMFDVAFSPDCAMCRACLPLRLPVATFTPSRQQKRVLQTHLDLTCRESLRGATLEQYHLFQRYQRVRHPSGAMREMNFDAYRDIVECSPVPSIVLEFRAMDGALVCVSLIDIMSCGISAIYNFYVPDCPHRSFGIYAILQLIALARQRHLPHLYLGNWVAASAKMAYKSSFRPAEIFQNNVWRPLETPFSQPKDVRR
ncbi:MAG: arginyltransferase [Acetobacteraceae bacterium]